MDIKWLTAPEPHNFPAAASYLSLILPPARVAKVLDRLRKGRLLKFKSKDILRASGLTALGVSNSHVKKDQKKIRNGTALSPLLLLRDERNGKVIIADGYHRLCAVYSFDEDAVIPCRIV